MAVIPCLHRKGQSDRKLRARSEGKTYFTQRFAASPTHLAVQHHRSQGQRGAQGQVHGRTSSHLHPHPDPASYHLHLGSRLIVGAGVILT